MFYYYYLKVIILQTNQFFIQINTPQTVMIIRMFAAMFSFVAFLLVILLGYGVASHTIMHPAQEFQQKAILDIIYG